jgi:hypothetical protein
LQGRRAVILERADDVVGHRHLRAERFGDDCTGFVRWAYAAAELEPMPREGRPGENGVTALYREARRRKALHWRRPRAGDLVFFRETYDRNRDGHRNDGLTHVGLVESVDKRGTVTYLHRAGEGIVRSRLTVRRPRWFLERGVRWNDYVRKASGESRAYLSGELFVAYASADAFKR